jgi:hypothetical protein
MTTPPKTVFHYFLVFLLFLQKYCAGELLLFFSIQFHEHHVLWLEDLFEVLKNFDIPII